MITKYAVTSGNMPANTPEGLYEKLVSMKAAGGSEAANINVPGVKGYVAASKGACQ